MVDHTADASPKTYARIAGVLYLVIIVIGALGEAVVRGSVIVPGDAAATAEALKFFAWSYKNGGKMAEDLDYVPMPTNVVADIEKTWTAEIKDSGGKPLFTN